MIGILLLALLGTAVPTTPTRAAAKSIAAWTHIVGTADCLVLFDSSDGRVFTNRAADGDFSFAQIYPFGAALAGFTHMAGTGDYIFFYNQATGQGAGYPINSRCALSNGVTQSGFATTWTHVVGIGDRVLLFYNQATGARASGYLNSQGTFLQQESSTFASGWSSIAAANDSVLFSRVGDAGTFTAFGTFDSNGLFSQEPDGNATFPQKWTHVAGARNGGFLFYNTRSPNTV